MLKDKKSLSKVLPILVILLIGAFFRFYKTDWGEGYFFHPDEYHIATAVSRLSFPVNLNPELFSYGSFTVYLIYFSKFGLTLINQSFKDLNPFLIGRFYSAVFSALTIINIYLISKELFKNKIFPLITSFLIAITPGLIQQAHFSTPESVLTFWLTMSLYLWLKWMKDKNPRILYLSAISLGIAAGTKVTALLLSPILMTLPFFSSKNFFKNFFKKIKTSFFLFLVFFTSFFLAFPYGLIDFKDFKKTIDYEGSLALGKIPVFYTRQFIGTKPIIFQITKILPYTLGLGIFVFGLIGLFIIFTKAISSLIKRKGVKWQWIIVLLSFSFLFFPNSLLFAKWTRFINPTFPFFIIFAVYLIEFLSDQINNPRKKECLLYSLSIFLTLSTLVWTMMFFSIYTKSDVRLIATSWINKNIPQNSLILTETGNMLEVPLWGNYRKISFDFYNLEGNPIVKNQLIQFLTTSNYFIVQSRRIYMNHQRLPNQFPQTAKFYNSLFSGSLGFSEIVELNSFPKLGSLEINDEKGEETWSVFDHPVIRIYQKVHPYPINYYAEILEK